MTVSVCGSDCVHTEALMTLSLCSIVTDIDTENFPFNSQILSASIALLKTSGTATKVLTVNDIEMILQYPYDPTMSKTLFNYPLMIINGWTQYGSQNEIVLDTTYLPSGVAVPRYVLSMGIGVPTYKVFVR